MTKEKRGIRVVCRACGGEHVRRDADAIWNVEKQQWELGEVYYNATCDDCGGETSLAGVRIETGKEVEGQLYPVHPTSVTFELYYALQELKRAVETLDAPLRRSFDHLLDAAERAFGKAIAMATEHNDRT